MTTFDTAKISSIDRIKGRIGLSMRNGLESVGTYPYDIATLREGMSVLIGKVDNSHVILNQVENVPRVGTSYSVRRPYTMGPAEWHLEDSTVYYTDIIGGGLGRVAVMTGGGNGANVGELDGRNDDGFMEYNIGFSFSLFNQVYTTCFLNNNGNVSFVEGISAYIPEGPTGAYSPIISIFFSDVDTRQFGGVMWIRDDIPNQLIVTWDNVDRYNRRGDLFNSFQLVFRGPNYSVPRNEGVIGFFYKSMTWETCSTSLTAAAGFGDGGTKAIVLNGSNETGLVNIVDHKKVWFSQRFINLYL